MKSFRYKIIRPLCLSSVAAVIVNFGIAVAVSRQRRAHEEFKVSHLNGVGMVRFMR